MLTRSQYYYQTNFKTHIFIAIKPNVKTTILCWDFDFTISFVCYTKSGRGHRMNLRSYSIKIEWMYTTVCNNIDVFVKMNTIIQVFLILWTHHALAHIISFDLSSTTLEFPFFSCILSNDLHCLSPEGVSSIIDFTYSFLNVLPLFVHAK